MMAGAGPPVLRPDNSMSGLHMASTWMANHGCRLTATVANMDLANFRSRSDRVARQENRPTPSGKMGTKQVWALLMPKKGFVAFAVGWD